MSKPTIPRADRLSASHDGAADLATFGALPIALIGAPALAGTGPTIASPAVRIAFAPVGHEVNGGHSGHSSTSPSSAPHPLAPALTGGAIAAPAVALASGTADVHTVPGVATPTSSGIATFVPIPHGSGAVAVADIAPVVTDVPHATADTAAPAMAMPAGDTIESMHASVAALQEALNTLAERLPAAPAAVTTGHDVSGAAAVTLDGVTAAADGIALAASATLSHVVDLTSDLAPAVSGVVAPVEATLDHVVAAVPDVGAAVEATIMTLGDVADGVTSAAALSLDHITGGDPVGGIATLVGMVSAADAFNLHDTGSDAGTALVPALGIAGSIDLLADVVPHEALLGIGDHHGDGFAGIDLHDGLFGHG